jgi:hypothetical protein
MMKVNAKFRPPLRVERYGSWSELDGEWDGSLFWFVVPGGEHKGRRLGVHLGSNTVFEEAVPAPIVEAMQAQAKKAAK